MFDDSNILIQTDHHLDRGPPKISTSSFLIVVSEDIFQRYFHQRIESVKYFPDGSW